VWVKSEGRLDAAKVDLSGPDPKPSFSTAARWRNIFYMLFRRKIGRSRARFAAKAAAYGG
jgi:hypothetical protein